MGDGCAVDDDVALRTLITLDGVDADLQQFGNRQRLDFAPNHTDLVAVGHDDADGFVGIEFFAVFLKDFFEFSGDNSGFGKIHFIVLTAIGSRGNKDDARRFARFFLMRKRHGNEFFATVEHPIRPFGDVGMHSTLTA